MLQRERRLTGCWCWWVVVQVLRSKEETDYMYASIDLVSHRLARHLR